METTDILRVIDEITSRLTELREQLADEPEPVFPKAKLKILDAGMCLQCYEEGNQKVNATQRGLCAKHYHETRRRVGRGETTYQWLVSQGLIAPKRPPGRKATDTVLGRRLRDRKTKS